MRVGYGKIGKDLALSSRAWNVAGGDCEPPRLLDTLARRHPEHQWVIVSECRDDPAACGFTPNVVNPWTPERLAWKKSRMKWGRERLDPASNEWLQHIADTHDALVAPLAEKLDALVLWIGEHGTANGIISTVTGRGRDAGLTRPYASFAIYTGHIIRLVNAWRDVDPLAREEVWLVADARNHLKARDVKWPLRHPVLGQFDFTHNGHHERYGDARSPEECGFPDARWKTDHTWEQVERYAYSRLEVCSILPEYVGEVYSEEWEDRRDLGIFINEAGGVTSSRPSMASRSSVSNVPRREVLKEWVLPAEPAFVHGKWKKDHEQELGRKVAPAPLADYYPLTRSVRCTLTTPSSCSGWATTKPFEAFAAGTVCFRHPGYDTQDHIYGEFTPEIREWLSPPTPEDFWVRVKALAQDRATWLHIVRAQKQLYDEACAELRWVKHIERRLGIDGG